MTQWEYTTTTIYAEPAAATEVLNKLGAERWEAFEMRFTGTSTVVWLKRPIIKDPVLTEG